MREIFANKNQEIKLGRRGENLAARVVFDITAWKSIYGDGVVQLVYKRNGDEHPYPCSVTVENNKVYWDITNTETESVGRGTAELQYWCGEVIAKSAVFNTRTLISMETSGEVPPEPVQNWLEKLLETGASLQENTTASAIVAQVSAESAIIASNEAKESAQEAKAQADNILAIDYCTKSDAKAYADAAEASAKAYADDRTNFAIGVAIGGSY